MIISWRKYLESKGCKIMYTWIDNKGFYAQTRPDNKCLDGISRTEQNNTILILDINDTNNSLIVGEDMEVVYEK